MVVYETRQHIRAQHGVEAGGRHSRLSFAALALSIALLMTAGWVGCRFLLLPALGGMLVVSDNLKHAEVIHVLSGGADRRAIHAINLYKLGYGERIFFTGGWCPDIQDTHTRRGRKLAIALGIPAQAIATDDGETESTYAEAARLQHFIAANPAAIRSVIVVSDPYHMRRAQWTFKWVLGDKIDVQMAPVPFEQTPYDRHWWSDPESRKMVLLEYVKLAYYFFKYRLGWGPLSNWLTRFDTW